MNDYREGQEVLVVEGYKSGKSATIIEIDPEYHQMDYVVRFDEGELRCKRDRSIRLLKCPTHNSWYSYIESKNEWECLICREEDR